MVSTARRDSYGRLFNGSTERLVATLAPAIDPLVGRTELLMDRQALALRRLLPSYGPQVNRVPDDCLLASAKRNVDRAVRTLRDGRAPTPEQVDEAWVARERAEQGLPTGEILDAYRLAHRVIRDEFLHAAAEQRIDQSAVVEGACLLWETADAGASRVYAVRRELELARARCDEEQRISFLHSLVRGSVDPGALRELVATYGLELERRYLAVRGRPRGSTSAEILRGQLERGSRLHGTEAFLGVIDGEVVGIVPRRPDLGVVEATVGVSAPAQLAATDQSFRAASRMLEVAARFDAVGVFDLGDLGLRVAIAAEPELGTLLAERYFGRLDAAGDFGRELESTLREYFVGGRQISRTARKLAIHPNTLRYRLHRFEEVVEVSLEDPKTLTELWWVLESRTLEQSHHL